MSQRRYILGLFLMISGCAGGSGDHSPIDGNSSNIGLKKKEEPEKINTEAGAADENQGPVVTDVVPNQTEKGKEDQKKPWDSWEGKFKRFYSVCSDPELKKEEHPEKKTALAIQDSLGGLNDKCEDTVRHLEVADRLNLSNKGLSDISVLGEFSHIRQLRLGENFIRSLDPIASLTELEVLDLSDNPVVDYEALRAMSGLSQLDLSQKRQNVKQVTDSILKYKQEMGKTSDSDILTQNQITDLTWRAMLEINQGRGVVRDLVFLKNCERLTELNLDYTSVINLAPLKPCNQLKRISVVGLKIEDFSPLLGHVGLMEIKLTPQLVNPDSLNALREAVPHMIVSEQSL